MKLLNRRPREQKDVLMSSFRLRQWLRKDITRSILPQNTPSQYCTDTCICNTDTMYITSLTSRIINLLIKQ